MQHTHSQYSNPWQHGGADWADIYTQLVEFHQQGGQFATLNPQATAEDFGSNRNCYSYVLDAYTTGNTALNPSNLKTLKPVDDNPKVGVISFECPYDEDNLPIIKKFQQDGMLVGLPSHHQIKDYTPFVLFHSPDPWHCTAIHLEQTTPTINFSFSSIFGHTRQENGGELYYTSSKNNSQLFDFFAHQKATLLFAPNYYQDAKLHKDIKQGYINISVDSPHDLFNESTMAKFLTEKAYWTNFYAAVMQVGAEWRKRQLDLAG